MKSLESKPNNSSQTQSKPKSSFFGTNTEKQHAFFSAIETNSKSFFQPSPPLSINGGEETIQRKPELDNKKKSDKSLQPQPEFNQKAFHAMLEKSRLMDEIKRPIAETLAKEYVPSIPAPTPQSVMTYSGGLSSVPEPIYAPSVNRVTDAITYWMDIKKTGKGNNASDWEWHWRGESDTKKKTSQEKDDEVYEVVASNVKEELVIKGAEISAEFIGNRLLKAVVGVIVPAYGLYCIIKLPFELFDLLKLLKSLREPSAREETKWEKESAEIVDKVRAWLQSKQEAAEFEDSLKKPKYYVPDNPKDGVLRR